MSPWMKYDVALGQARQMSPLFVGISGFTVFAEQIDRNKTCWCADVRAARCLRVRTVYDNCDTRSCGLADVVI